MKPGLILLTAMAVGVGLSGTGRAADVETTIAQGRLIGSTRAA